MQFDLSKFLKASKAFNEILTIYFKKKLKNFSTILPLSDNNLIVHYFQQFFQDTYFMK